MNFADSQFEIGRMDNYKRDFHRTGSYWDHDEEHSRTKFEYTNSVETNETSEEFIFRIPLSEISIENLKIIPGTNFLIVQSNKKTIFISLTQGTKPESFSTSINGTVLAIAVKK